MLARHRLESHHHRRPPEAGGVRLQSLEQGAVTEMDAVEAADRDGTSTLAVAQIGKSTNEPHERLEPRKAER